MEQVNSKHFIDHLAVMRRNYGANRLTYAPLRKPLWLTLRPQDPLNVIYRDACTVYQHGQVYWGSIVQANKRLYERGSTFDAPANLLYSTHPVTEKYPEMLMKFALELYSCKGKLPAEVPDSLREVVRIITDEADRSSVDYLFSMDDLDNSNRIIEKIDLHFCSMMIFRNDLPGGVLQGHIIPVLAAPERSPAVLLLPRKFWTLPYYV
jgi:hypothetical protein